MKPAKSATLLVPEEEVPKLHLAGTRGKITLAMRGEDDKSQNSPAVAYGSDIMKGGTLEPAALVEAAEPIPAPPTTAKKDPPTEPNPYSVIVFHGATMTDQPTTMEQITFESAQSSRILSMAQGAPTRAAATMTGTKDRGRPTKADPTRTEGVAKQPAKSEETEAESDVVEDTPGDQ
jgi:hypothetical protein